MTKNLYLSLLVTLMSVMAFRTTSATAADQINYTVYPSNKDVIEAYELKHLTFTFPDAKSVTIDDAFMSDNSKVEIFDTDGNRLYKSDCTAWYSDVWKTEGNQLHVDLSESFGKFTTSGNYLLVLSNIKVDDEPVKLEIPYQLNVKRMAPEEEATLITPQELDENNILWLTYDTKNYGCYGYAINGIGIAYDDQNNIVGLVSNHYKEIYTDARRYGLEIYFYDDVDPTIRYHIDFEKGIFTLADPYGTPHETAATTAYFWRAGASAIDTIGLDNAPAASYDLFGRQTTELQGFGVKNGKKMFKK